MQLAEMVAGYALALAQALVPWRVFVAILLGALVFWLAPRVARRHVLLLVSLAVILFGYERPPALIACVVVVCGAVYMMARRGVAHPPLVAGLSVLYAALHGLIGLLTFTPWLDWTGLTTAAVLPTIGLTTAFTFLRLVHFAVDFAGGRWMSAMSGTRPDALTYVTWSVFFPTFVHLPLIRYPAWAGQFNHLPARLDWKRARSGLLRIAQAVFKGAVAGVIHVLLNPTGALLRFPAVAPGEFVLSALLSAITYYIGFSAYVDLGIGAARLYGIDLPENFAPVAAFIRISRMRDFWRNWNMTMTRWMNDYVYQALGGHRRHPIRNVMLTMIVCGLWHSVSLFGVLWGAGLGLMLLAEHGWNRGRIRRNWPELPAPLRQGLLLAGLSLVNLFLTPYAYDPGFGRYLYPLFWIGIVPAG